MLSFRSAAVLLVVCLATARPSMASTLIRFPGFTLYNFDFTAFPDGMATPFSETIGGLTIDYSALDDRFAFSIGNIPGYPSPSPLLLAPPGSSTLQMSLSQSAFGALVEFVSLGPAHIHMDLLSGGPSGIVVGSQSVVIPPGPMYQEGGISLLPVCICPNSFDAVTLSSDSSLAVSRIGIAQNVNMAEPTTLAMLCIGLLLAAIRFRAGPTQRIPQIGHECQQVIRLNL